MGTESTGLIVLRPSEEADRFGYLVIRSQNRDPSATDRLNTLERMREAFTQFQEEHRKELRLLKMALEYSYAMYHHGDRASAAEIIMSFGAQSNQAGMRLCMYSRQFFDLIRNVYSFKSEEAFGDSMAKLWDLTVPAGPVPPGCEPLPR